MDGRLTRIRELIDLKERTDAELEALIGGASSIDEQPRGRKTQSCSLCHQEGHTARNCPQKGEADGVHRHQDHQGSPVPVSST